MTRELKTTCFLEIFADHFLELEVDRPVQGDQTVRWEMYLIVDEKKGMS